MTVSGRMLIFLFVIGNVLALHASVLEDDVVVLVGERKISRAMLTDAVNQALNTSYYHGRLTPERRQELERKHIQELIRRELNVLGAFDRGMDLPATSAEQSRAKIEDRLGKGAYETALKSVKMTRKNHARAIAETLLAEQAYNTFVLEPAQITDEEIRVVFNASPNHWQMPESIHVLHILLKVHPEEDEEGIALVQKQVDSLKERLAKGEDFSTLAAEFSQDMYQIKGGDLGWVHRGRLLTELEEIVWNSDIGICVGPIRSLEGFHLVKVLARRVARPMEFVEVEPLLREQLEKQRLEASESTWFEALRKKYPVIILDPGLGEKN